MKSSLKLSFIVTVTICFLLSLNVIAGSEPLWKITFEKGIDWQKLAPTGHLIVGTDEGLFGINPENGETIWKIEELKGLDEDKFEFVPYTAYALINKSKGFLGTQNKLVLIDVENGNELWDTGEMEIQTAMGQFVLPEVSGIMVYVLDKKGKKNVFCADLKTGNIIWENKDFFKKRDPNMHQLSKTKQTIVGNQEPLFDSDETMSTFMNKKAIRKWNAKTGQLIWETEVKAKGSPALQWGFAPMILNEAGDILYTPADKTVYAVRTSDGNLLWQKPPKLDGMVYQMQLTSSGLIVKGGPNMQGKDGKPFIQVLDVSTGEPIWKKEFKKLKEGTNFVVNGDKIVVYSDKKLYSINIADGEYTEIAKDLKFDGKEIPGSLQLRDDGYYMQSSNNLMLVGFDGNEIYHAYHKAPGSSLFAKIATTAVITAVNVGSAASAYSRASAQAAQYGRGEARYTLITSNPTMSKRFKASKNAENYTYILTNVEADGDKGPGLVKVNKDTGKTDNQIVLGTKEPEYEMDEIESRLFFKADKKEIECYQF